MKTIFLSTELSHQSSCDYFNCLGFLFLLGTTWLAPDSTFRDHYRWGTIYGVWIWTGSITCRASTVPCLLPVPTALVLQNGGECLQAQICMVGRVADARAPVLSLPLSAFSGHIHWLTSFWSHWFILITSAHQRGVYSNCHYSNLWLPYPVTLMILTSLVSSHFFITGFPACWRPTHHGCCAPYWRHVLPSRPHLRSSSSLDSCCIMLHIFMLSLACPLPTAKTLWLSPN